MDVSVLLEPEIDLPRLAEVLDGLGHDGRVHTTCTWNKDRQRKLFEAAKGFKPATFDQLVPPGIAPLVGVSHDGHNSLPPPFSHFVKHFCRLPNDAERIAGYNTQRMEMFTGPGYFSVTEGKGEHEGELVLSYDDVPSVKPEGWPPIVKNDGFISGIVNGGMIDYLRALSSHVLIGAAFKNGKSRNEFFTIVRKDVS